MELINIVFGTYVDIAHYIFGGQEFWGRVFYTYDGTSPYVIHNGIKLELFENYNLEV